MRARGIGKNHVFLPVSNGADNFRRNLPVFFSLREPAIVRAYDESGA